MALPEGSYTQFAYVVKNVGEAANRWIKNHGRGTVVCLGTGNPQHDLSRKTQ